MKQLTIHLPSVAPMEFYRGEQPRLSALERLLSRGSAAPFTPEGESTIFAETAPANISCARQRFAGEVQPPDHLDNGFWYCADPVYLRADRDRVVLLHPTSIDIKESEADALIEAFNQLFKEDGVELWRASSGKGCADRWYLRSDTPWQITTTPLDSAIGRGIRELMPQGVDALRWRKVLAEAEMLFFAHPVNQRRSESGELLINSIWLWGEQERHHIQRQPWDVLVGDHPLLQGGSRLQDIPMLAPLSAFDELISRIGNGLLIIDELLQQQRAGGLDDIPALLQELEQRVFVPALDALRQGKIDRLTIQPANGNIYTIRRHHLLRFWRKSKQVWYEG